jgi:ribosome-binding protein aMBF1 (putative translation factor)
MTEKNYIPVNEWLRRVGDIEAQHDITVGVTHAQKFRSKATSETVLTSDQLGKLVESKRLEMGWPVSQLADVAHVTVNDVENLEQGLTQPVDFVVLQSVSRALQLPSIQLAYVVGEVQLQQ